MEVRIGTYDEFLKSMHDGDWVFLNNKSPNILTEEDTKFVKTHHLTKGVSGKFVEIFCPLGMCMTINGEIQLPQRHHHISVRCRNCNEDELQNKTRIRLEPLNFNGLPKTTVYTFYDQISQTKGSRFKTEEEQFYLEHRGLIIYGGEQFAFYADEADIDISNVNLLLECDIFVKKENIINVIK